jgi:hypothetical protein
MKNNYKPEVCKGCILYQSPPWDDNTCKKCSNSIPKHIPAEQSYNFVIKSFIKLYL